MAILTYALFWGLLPVITSLAYVSLAPISALFFSTFFAMLFFAIWLTISHRWSELKIRAAWADILWSTLLNAVAFFSLLFLGLKFTTPNNASIIALFEVLFSYLFFNVWKKEYLSAKQLLGCIAMVAGAVIVLAPKTGYFHIGDVLVMLAAAVAPFGNYFQVRARKIVSSQTILFSRCLIALPFLFILSKLFSETISYSAVHQAFWFILINGAVFLGLATFLWFEGIHRISVTKAISLTSIAPLFTVLFSYLILKQNPTAWQLIAFVPIFVGLLLLTSNKLTIAKSNL